MRSRVRAVSFGGMGIRMKTYSPNLLIGAFASLSLLVPSTALSAACSRYTSAEIAAGRGHLPKNVILIVLDDASIADLPTFNRPIVWENNESSGGVGNSAAVASEAGYVSPDLNRFQARAYAASSGDLGTLKNGPVSSTNPTIKPFDIPPTEYPGAVSAPNVRFRYSTISSEPHRHVLRGFGGFGKLARNGVTIGRFYGASSVCAPARAAILTGRHPAEVGVPTLNRQPDLDEVMIPNFLAMGGGPVLYRTAMFGKWDLGNDPNSNPERFFDVVVGAWGSKRAHFSRKPMQCSPAFEYLGPDAASASSCLAANASSDPLCCSAEEKYDFKRKKKDGATGRYWQYRGEPACTGPTTPQILPSRASFAGGPANGCLYDTRFLGDAARNFIIRTAAEGQPFFVYFAPQAPHYPNDAPEMTVKHYATGRCSDDQTKVCSENGDCSPGLCINRLPQAPGGKQNPRRFWAALEELDAALGGLLQAVEGFCTDGSNAGRTCAEAPGCTCNTTLADETVVLLTSDNAHEGSLPGYGTPWFRGNKLSLEEGGMRLGLSAWFGNGTFAVGESSSNADATAISNAVGSHVDLLPTIAHASGCKPDANGQYSLSVCQGDPEYTACTLDTDCVGIGQGDKCLERKLAGRSLLPLLSAKVRGYNEGAGGSTIKARRYAFAERSEAPPAIVAAKAGPDTGDVPTVSVCGARVSGTMNPAESVYPERQAGSSFVCGTLANPGCDDGELCNSNGRFCVPTDFVPFCTDGRPGCEWQRYRRCELKTECPSAECMSVTVRCNQCPVASWKLRGLPSPAMTATELYDLSTNPEERVDLNLLTGSSAASFSGVRDVLLKHLKGWYKCVTTQGGEDGLTSDCESQEEP